MPIAEADISIEVVEFYPNLEFRLPKKLKEQGTCHVILKVGDLSMEIKNIRYQIRSNGGVWVGPPINIYPNHEANEKSQALKRKKEQVAKPIYISVPTITFEDPIIFDKIKEAIEKDLFEEF